VLGWYWCSSFFTISLRIFNHQAVAHICPSSLTSVMRLLSALYVELEPILNSIEIRRGVCLKKIRSVMDIVERLSDPTNT
jgi:hypothetical protein